MEPPEDTPPDPAGPERLRCLSQQRDGVSFRRRRGGRGKAAPAGNTGDAGGRPP